MRPSLQNKRDQSTTARSGWVVLCRPSSLQGRSDTPLPVTPLLPVVPDLSGAFRRRKSTEAVGLQVQVSSLFSRIPMALPRVPDRFACPFHPLSTVAFPINVEGRRVAHHRWVCPPTGLFQLYLSGLISRGCTIRFMLRSAGLASTPGCLRLMSIAPVGAGESVAGGFRLPPVPHSSP